MCSNACANDLAEFIHAECVVWSVEWFMSAFCLICVYQNIKNHANEKKTLVHCMVVAVITMANWANTIAFINPFECCLPINLGIQRYAVFGNVMQFDWICGLLWTECLMSTFIKGFYWLHICNESSTDEIMSNSSHKMEFYWDFWATQNRS